MKRHEKILFTEAERRRKERRDKLVGGFKSVGKKMYSSAKKGIERERRLRKEEKDIYNETFRKEKLKQIQRKATRDAISGRRKKGIFEL